MSEKEFSKNGNISYAPEQQVDAELLLPENDDAAEAQVQEAEFHPADAELLPPENDDAAEAQVQEAEFHPVEAELSPPENDPQADEHEDELNAVKEESTPTKNDGAGKAERQMALFHPADLILRSRNDGSEAERNEAERKLVEAESPAPENYGQRKTERQKPLHPADDILSRSRNDEVEAERNEAELNPIEAESSRPKYNARKADRQKALFHPADLILRSRNNDLEAERNTAECNPVGFESPAPENNDQRETERQKPLFPPADAILSRSKNDDIEAGHEVEFHPLETESKDSGCNSSLEGAVGGVTDECNCRDIHFSPCKKSTIQYGKEDLFIKFFSDEYDQANAPIQGRQRHSAQIQRPRQRHASEDSKLSDQNPLGCLQDAGTSGGAVLNQAGAIIGKYIPNEEVPDYARFGTEFGQSLPVIPTTEGSEHSIGSISTARIGDVYGGTFSVVSDDSTDGQGISFASFPSRPPTSASDNLERSPPHDSNSPEDDKEQLRTTADTDNTAHEKPVQQKSGTVTKPEPIRSKSALAGLSAYAGESQDRELQKRKVSSDMYVRSEPLPQRKISQDSSVNSEQMSSEDDVNYPELSHSLEIDSYVPKPDIDTAVVDSLEENLGSLTISDTESLSDAQNVLQQTKASESSEQDSLTKCSIPETDDFQPQG